MLSGNVCNVQLSQTVDCGPGELCPWVPGRLQEWAAMPTLRGSSTRDRAGLHLHVDSSSGWLTFCVLGKNSLVGVRLAPPDVYSGPGKS